MVMREKTYSDQSLIVTRLSGITTFTCNADDRKTQQKENEPELREPRKFLLIALLLKLLAVIKQLRQGHRRPNKTLRILK